MDDEPTADEKGSEHRARPGLAIGTTAGVATLFLLLRRVGALTVAGFLALAIVVDTPWMPRERIAVGDEVIQGYVLTAEAGFIRVLTDERDVAIVNSSEVTSRTIID